MNCRQGLFSAMLIKAPSVILQDYMIIIIYEDQRRKEEKWNLQVDSMQPLAAGHQLCYAHIGYGIASKEIMRLCFYKTAFFYLANRMLSRLGHDSPITLNVLSLAALSRLDKSMCCNRGHILHMFCRVPIIICRHLL